MRLEFLFAVAMALLGACGFNRDNPHDLENADYVSVEITTQDGIVVEGDSTVIRFDAGGSLDSMEYQFLGNGSAEWVGFLDADSLVLSGLDEGDYVIAIKVKNGGNTAIDTVHFTVDAVNGPALLLSPRAPRADKGDTLAIGLVAEEVAGLLGVNARIHWNAEDLEYVGTTTKWNVFAEADGDSALDVSAVYLDSAAGFHGTGLIAELKYVVRTEASGSSILIETAEARGTANESMPLVTLRGSALR